MTSVLGMTPSGRIQVSSLSQKRPNLVLPASFASQSSSYRVTGLPGDHVFMPFQPWRPRRALAVCLGLVSLLMSSPTWAAEKMRLQVDDYQIEAELTPHTHKLVARAKVKFTALEK